MSARPLNPRCLIAWLALVGVAAGDEVVLDSGARLRGRLVEDSPADRARVVLETDHGRLAIDRDRVYRLRTRTPAETDYDRRAPSVSDTPEAQYALATWCRDNGQDDAMRRHLNRVLELQPDHEAARTLLGYTQVDGEWMTRTDVLASRGLRRWQGEFLTAQEVELLKRTQEVEAKQIDWRRRLAKLRADLGHRDPDTAREAGAALEGLTDPEATPELLALLADEASPLVRRRLVDLVGRLGAPQGLVALAGLALNDPDIEVRAIALERLAEDGRPGLAALFVSALGSPNNVTVNYAADALAMLGSAAAIDPMIDALVTTHRWKTGNDSGGDTYSVSPNAGTFGFGGGGPKIVEKQLQNPRVLAALVHLTGVNFLYDQDRWRAWLAGQQQEQAPPLRRDA